MCDFSNALLHLVFSTYWSYTLMCAGMALIKPTSFLLLATRTPQCHCIFQPGGLRALKKGKCTVSNYSLEEYHLAPPPFNTLLLLMPLVK